MTMPIVFTVLSYFIFSAAVGAMHPPTGSQEEGWYGWLYRFLQILAANASRLAQARLAGTGIGISNEGVTASTTTSSTLAVERTAVISSTASK